MAAAVFRTIFAQPAADAVGDAWDEVVAQLGIRFPKVAALTADGKPEVLAFCAFPRLRYDASASLWTALAMGPSRHECRCNALAIPSRSWCFDASFIAANPHTENDWIPLPLGPE